MYDYMSVLCTLHSRYVLNGSFNIGMFNVMYGTWYSVDNFLVIL